MQGDRDEPLLHRLAAELDAMRGELEGLGSSLCGDADVAARHVIALQALDEIGQRVQAIAAVLRAGDRCRAARALPLAGLAARLAAA